MNLNNAYPLFQEITGSAAQLEQHKADLHGIKTSQSIWSIATFFIYLSFTSVLFAGVSVFALQDYLFANKTNVVGMLWVIIVTLSVPAALSLAKHFNYKAIAKDGFNDRRKIQTIIYFIIALAIISGIYYESISASTNLQVKSFHAADNSAMGKSLTNATIVNSGASGMAESIANAQKTYNACLVKLEQAKKSNPSTKFHCDGDKGRLDSLKEQANAERASNAEASIKAQAVNHDLMKAERTEQAIPPAKYASQIFNTSIDGGVMIITLIAALLLELIHVTTIFNESRTLKNIRYYTDMLKDLNGSYFKITGKTFSPDDFTDDRTLDLSDKPLNVPMDDQGADFEIRTKGTPYADNKTGFGFIPQTAKLFKWQADEVQAEKPGFGFIPARSNQDQDAANRAKYPQEILYPTGKGKTADDYALIPREDFKRTNPAVPGHTYRDELRTGSSDYRDMPLDATTTPPAEKPRVEPSEQPAEKPRVEPRARGLEKADENHVHAVSDAPKAHTTTETLYPAWIAAVRAGECRASVNESRAWIQKHIAPVMTGSKTNDLKRIDQMRKGFFSRAIREGLMQINTTYRNGGKKYNWIG